MDTLSKVHLGNPCKFGSKKSPSYGKEIPLAVYVDQSMGERVTLIKSFRKQLRLAVAQERPRGKRKFSRKAQPKARFRGSIQTFFSFTISGGNWWVVDRGKVLSARLSYENAQSLGWLDSRGRFLLIRALRRMTRDFDSPFLQKDSCIREDLIRRVRGSKHVVPAWFD